MKGVFVHTGLEYRVEMPKDEVSQEDVMPCVVTVKNHSPAEIELQDVTLELVWGNPKSADAKDAGLELVAAAELPLPWKVAPGQEQKGEWTFELNKNAPVSDKSKSLIFRYGRSSGQMNLLPIHVVPHPHVNEIIGYFQSSFQFVLKGMKASKGWTEAKFKPPSNRELSFVKEMVVGFHFEAESLQMRYRFSMKKFEGTESGVKVGKGKATYECELLQSQYVLSGGYLKQEFIEASIKEALATVSSGL